MLPYFLVGLLSVFGIFVSKVVYGRVSTVKFTSAGTVTTTDDPPKVGSFGYLLVAGLLIAFAGARYSTGSDYFLYLSLYQAFDHGAPVQAVTNSTQGVGFGALMLFLKTVTDHPYIIFWVSSVLTVGPVLLAVKRKSVDPVFAVFIYYFLGYYAVSFNAVRQSIAVALLLLADTYREESRFKYLTLSAMAVLIHSSAIVLVLSQFFVKFWRPTKRNVFVLFIVTVPLAIPILNSNILASISMLLNARYEIYLQGDGAGIGTILALVVKLGLVVLVLSLPKVRDSDRYIAFVCLSAIFLYLGLFSWVIARLEVYFGIFLMLLLPNQLAKWRHGRMAKALLGIAMAVYFAFYISNYNAIVPYILLPEFLW